MVIVAYDSLDPALKRELPIVRSNTGELAVKFVRHEEAKTNAMFAGTRARGGAIRSSGSANGASYRRPTWHAARRCSRALCHRSATGCASWRRHGKEGATGICGA